MLCELIEHNAGMIEKDEGRTRHDAEYLSICLVLDDLVARPNGAKGHKIIMDMLSNEYSQHHDDVITYLAVNSGQKKLKPEEEQALIKRHQKKRKKSDEVFEIMDDAILFASEKWTSFVQSFPFKDSVTLREKILIFMNPAKQGLLKNFPELQDIPDVMHTIIIANGIIQSGINTKEEVESSLGMPLPILK